MLNKKQQRCIEAIKKASLIMVTQEFPNVSEQDKTALVTTGMLLVLTFFDRHPEASAASVRKYWHVAIAEGDQNDLQG